MSISIEFKDKYVYFGPEAGLHTQGEARAEVYDVTGPRYHDGHDLSAMTWYVRASHPDYMTIINKRLRVSVAPGNEEQIIITWPVDADFTAYSGSLDVQFVAKSSTGEENIKLQSNGLQLAASVEGTVIPPRNMFEAAVEQIEQLADDAANAAAQSKLEADRAEDSQKAAAQSAQQAQKSVQDMQQSVKDAAELVKQIEGDAESAAASASDAAENASISKDWAAGKPVTYSGTPVSIAYAGANRIASITAYGENAQGGTTEAPVALTGVDSVFVGGRNLLPKATETKTLNGVTFTPNPDGSVSVSGTATNDTSYPFKEGLDDSLFDQTVCLSGGSIQTQLVINEKKHSGKWVRNVIVNAKIPAVVGVLSKQADDNILYGTIYVPTGTTVNTTIYPMLNLGNTAMPYEPYQGSVTPLPIPCPLHKVGDVRDVCRTRVKSVYDKRIVLDGAEDWKMGSAVGDGAPYIFCDLLNDHYQAFPIISSRFPSTNILASNKNQGIGCWDRSLYLRYDSLFTNVEELKTYLSAHPLTVYYQSTAYDGTNGLDVCLMKYQTGFVELDGTEGIEYQSAYNRFAYTLPSTAVNDSGFCSHYKKLMTSAPGEDKYIVIRPEAVYFYDSQYTNADAFNAYFAAQKEAGTPVQVAYQLAAPEVYATDPVDFDNAAGPLTVMTGGEVEVRMTELVGSRSDVSNNTVAFSEAAQDADIASGEKLSVLFGKIKKRFSVVNKLVNGAVYPNLLDNSDFTNLVNQRGEAVYDYLTGIGYGPDRWQLVEAKYTLASQTVTSTGSSHTYGSQLRQIIPLEKIKIGDTVTASISTESGILNGTAKLELKIDTSVSDLPYVIEQDWGGVKIGCIKENVCHVIVFFKENKSVKINWVKLEKGSVATPYVPKSYRAELAECQRYFYRIYNSTWQTGSLISGWGFIVPFDTPVPMRSNPTINFVDAGLKVFAPSGWVNATSAETYGFNKNCARVNVKLIITLPSDIEGRSMLVTGIESFSADF